MLQSAPAPAQPTVLAPTTLSATDANGNTWTAVYGVAAAGMAMFNGQNANTDAISLTISENGVVAATEDSTSYYLTNPYSPLGLSGTTNGTAWIFLVTGYTPFPATLTVGDSGPVSSGTYYDGTGTVITGSLTQTYTVTADSPTDLLLNIDAAGTNNGNQVTETITYSITSTGAAALVEVVLTVNGETLDFK
jgi:hypothetical protein